MERRICTQVINEMLKHIPTEKEEFIKDLLWNLNDSSYKAPEDTIQWERTMGTIQKHIPMPEQEWELEVCSIFTTKSVNDIKETVETFKILQSKTVPFFDEE